MPEPPPVHDLVEADLWDQLPADLEDVLALLPRADLSLQDEMQVAFHPTLTRVWSRKGRRGQRLVEAPGDNRKVYGFGLLDWRDGWFDGRVAAGRAADVFCQQVRSAVARSKQRGRVVIVIADNLKTHTSAGSLLVRSMLTELKERLYLVSTPAYMILTPTVLNGSGASRGGWSRIIIIAARSTFCSRIWRGIFRHWLGLLLRFFVISIARGSLATYPCRIINLEAYSQRDAGA
ncbi:MAG: transposase [Ktedonobacteraceae bacterium]